MLELEDEDIVEKLKVRVEVGKDEDGNVVVKMERMDGDELCYRRLSAELRSTFLFAVDRQ